VDLYDDFVSESEAIGDVEVENKAKSANEAEFWRDHTPTCGRQDVTTEDSIMKQPHAV